MLQNVLVLVFVILQLHAELGFNVNAREETPRIVRADHGEHCNKTKRCNTNVHLRCRNSICECERSDSMYYDPTEKQCLVLVGEKCRFQVIEGEDEIGFIPYPKRTYQEEVDCVRNAWCNRSGVCMCAGDYSELSNGTCLSKRNFEETCTTDSECRQDRFLSCINGTCKCNSTTSTYNVLLRQCVGKAGFPCLGSVACVYNADCTNTIPEFTKRRNRQFAKTCSCNPGYVSDDSGLCKVGLGGECSATKLCADSFKCKDGQCVCKYENVQLAMIRMQVCISLVHGPCNETVNFTSESETPDNTTSSMETFQCVDNANCGLSDGNFYECRCNEGFVENQDGTCDLAFGESCQSPYSPSMIKSAVDVSISWNSDLSCDRATPLYCVNGVCDCESSLYEYDSLRSKCLGKVGAKCRVSNVTSSECIPDATCFGSRGLVTEYGTCICSEGFFSTNNRTCTKSPTGSRLS